ncbi:hypothetical protein C1H76_2161 [Elsinoe australis]|uniref:Uncharacterized protein n=1 Tax=Elsinoe australis TaxID=40998 RepID=A0A4U7B770_9PEZI|nr:hypothetical protein C1H76_2161 [Elsinoe australis]
MSQQNDSDDRLAASIRNLAAEFESLKAGRTKIEAVIEESDDQMHSMEGHVKSLQNQITAMQFYTEGRKLKANAGTWSSDDHLFTEVVSLKAKVSKHEKKLRNSAAAKRELQQTIDAKDEHIRLLQNVIDDPTDKVTRIIDLERSKTADEGRIRSLQETIDQYRMRLDFVEENDDWHKTKCKRRKAKLLELRSDYEQADKSWNRLVKVFLGHVDQSPGSLDIPVTTLEPLLRTCGSALKDNALRRHQEQLGHGFFANEYDSTDPDLSSDTFASEQLSVVSMIEMCTMDLAAEEPQVSLSLAIRLQIGLKNHFTSGVPELPDAIVYLAFCMLCKLFRWGSPMSLVVASHTTKTLLGAYRFKDVKQLSEYVEQCEENCYSRDGNTLLEFHSIMHLSASISDRAGDGRNPVSMDRNDTEKLSGESLADSSRCMHVFDDQHVTETECPGADLVFVQSGSDSFCLRHNASWDPDHPGNTICLLGAPTIFKQGEAYSFVWNHHSIEVEKHHLTKDRYLASELGHYHYKAGGAYSGGVFMEEPGFRSLKGKGYRQWYESDSD